MDVSRLSPSKCEVRLACNPLIDFGSTVYRYRVQYCTVHYSSCKARFSQYLVLLNPTARFIAQLSRSVSRVCAALCFKMREASGENTFNTVQYSRTKAQGKHHGDQGPAQSMNNCDSGRSCRSSLMKSWRLIAALLLPSEISFASCRVVGRIWSHSSALWY